MLPRTIGSTAVKAVFLVVPALAVQRAASSIELALLRVKTVLLVPISPLMLAVAPILVAMSRLTIHLPADVFHHIPRGLGMYWRGTQRQYGGNRHYR